MLAEHLFPVLKSNVLFTIVDNKEKKDGELVENDLFLGQSAFLGPTLWDKTLPVDVGDFQLEYMDLDEFLK